ncbi:ATP-dependent RNA helicase HrpA [Halorhodospira abdelmalekii]|uniref:ATP-dependent RNA helicase HrpA n=1 Tax=Halorhodospira abdelmalekii TaxID=421629 RepID=UPI0019070492|nr:ATP-dependent RNA helicase HrpA [Halorhodospira abdelmalekii]MBK1733931.1 ATP-dependent RNA helicase HrpA [Halorhodospira abdelmalekii]
MLQLEYDPRLPVVESRPELLAAIRAHPVVIVCGATGSGKSTQLPKMALELGRGVQRRIGHTQPRRIAARSLAARLAEETGCELGGGVGYKVRFTDQVSAQTQVKVLTDGMLLAEIQSDPRLEAYDTLIIDEAHERSLNIDFLLGYLKRLLPERPDLKLIVTSATIDPQRFAEHFDDAPVFEVSGRTYPVEVRYRPFEERDGVELPQAVVDAVHELTRAGPGDVLVFLSGEREIRECAEALRRQPPAATEILPLYARLSSAEQQRVFRRGGGRRVVLATNVAETSLTVPGIRYVVDSGRARISRYSHRTKVSRLPIEPIAQASADQRAGRCGREAPGICIRLYAEEDYASRPRFTDPEILRTNLAGVILQMKALGLGEIERFPFIEPPEQRYINDALRLLFELEAVDEQRRLTARGRHLARIPADPRIARILLAGREHGVEREVLIIAAALAIQDPRERPLEAQEAADRAHGRWYDAQSDFVALLNLWHDYQQQRQACTRRQLTQWCREHFLAPQRLREWAEVRRQFAEMLQEAEPGQRRRRRRAVAASAPAAVKSPSPSSKGSTPASASTSTAPAASTASTEGAIDERYEAIHRALLTGFATQVARHHEERTWLGTRGVKLQIFPGSGLANKRPRWIMAGELLETRRLFARTVAAVRPEWIEAAALHLVSRSYSEPRWQRRAGRVVAEEQVTLFGLVLVSGRKVNYARIDRERARQIFLYDGLVAGAVRTRGDFLRHNQALAEEIERLEAKSRRRDLLADAEQWAAFYAARIPENICDAAAFEKWRRRAERKEPQLLHMSRADLLRQGAAAPPTTAEHFPDTVQVAGIELPLAYHLEPGTSEDGVTAMVPIAALNALTPAPFEWLVPGLRHEKVTALIRGLPKRLRRHFVPAPEFARAVLESIPAGEGSLLDATARELQRMTGVELPAGALEAVELPVHLQMSFRVIDRNGEVLACGRDLAALQREFGEQARTALSQAANGSERKTEWQRSGIKSWDFGALPHHITLEQAGVKVHAYPALRDERESVALTLCDSAEEAARVCHAGVRRLFMLALPQQVRMLRKLDELRALRLKYHGLGSDDELRDAVLRAAFDRCFLEGEMPREPELFTERLAAGRAELVPTAQRLCRDLDEVLTRYQSVRKSLKRLRQPALLESLQDIEAHLGTLIYPGFIEQTPAAQLSALPRYLKALEQRIDKLQRTPSKDRLPLRTIRPWHERVHQRLAARAERGVPDPQLEQLRWLLEEYRVSLFAQEVGTREKVSEKRLEALWRALP